MKIFNIPKKFKSIRCRIRHPQTFIKSTYTIVEIGKGVRVLVGRQAEQDNLKAQTTIFNTDPNKGDVWNLSKAKGWVKDNKQALKKRIFAQDIIKGIKKSKKIKQLPTLSDTELSKSVEKLKEHFYCFPRRLKTNGI